MPIPLTPEQESNRLLNIICIGCGRGAVVTKSESPHCGTCYFRFNIVLPMLIELAPTSELLMVEATGNLAARMSRRTAIFQTPTPNCSRAIIHGMIGATYETVRKLVNPDYIFDWRKWRTVD